ncbi:MAG: formylglycine-generating enzyme family protein [Polyangiaceae bacterium]
MDRTEVTVRAYQVCMQKGGCSPASTVTPPAADAEEPAGEDSPPADQFAEAWSRRCNEPQRFLDHPINCVDWSSADNYCRFVGRRLPTEAEWELAARGPAARVYAWGGAAPDCQRACYDKNQSCRPAGEDVATCAVMSRKGDVTTDGVFDLGGNVAEWVVDGFAPTPAGGDDPRGPEAAPLRVVKGAGFVDEAPRLHAAVRDGMAPAAAAARVGFRCAADVPVDAHTVPPER